MTTWLVVAVGAWLVWIGALFFLQRRMIFPTHLLNPVPSESPPVGGVERVALETASGAGLAYYIPPGGPDGDGEGAADGGGAPALIFAHGNAELARDWTPAYRSLARQGVAVLLVEYPGYGDAPGSPTRRSLTDVATAAWDHLSARPEVDSTRIVGLGRSLGSGAVTELAARRPLAGLILQSAFTRIRDFAPRMLAPPFLVRDPFDNLAALERFDGPVLLFHGRRDGVIPYAHGRRLAGATDRAELVTWSCGHNDCPPDWDAYLARVTAFVKNAPPVEARPDSRNGGGVDG